MKAPAAPEGEGAADTTTAPEARVKSSGIKLKELLVRVAEQSDAPKKTQREVSEAVLAVLGAALAAGEELNLPGLGRLKVVKSADKTGGAVLTVKVKNAGQKKEAGGKEALADAGEDS